MGRKWKVIFHCSKSVFEVFADCNGCIKYCSNKPRTLQHDIIKKLPLDIGEDTIRFQNILCAFILINTLFLFLSDNIAD